MQNASQSSGQLVYALALASHIFAFYLRYQDRQLWIFDIYAIILWLSLHISYNSTKCKKKCKLNLKFMFQRIATLTFLQDTKCQIKNINQWSFFALTVLWNFYCLWLKQVKNTKCTQSERQAGPEEVWKELKEIQDNQCLSSCRTNKLFFSMQM